MTFRGFGRDSGPSAPPKSQPLFGHVSRPPSPASLHHLQIPTIQQASRDLDAPEESPFSSVPFNHIRPEADYICTVANLNRPPLSPHGLDAGKNLIGMTDAQPISGPSTLSRDTNAESAVSHVVSKRTRSPSSRARHISQGKSHLGDDETERELRAKAKRLARFEAELSVPIEKTAIVLTKNDQPKLEKQRMLGDCCMESMDDVEIEHLQPTGPIIGLCPNMCPVSEREERERKGDLDQYERVDGDRNRSSQDLAVKKYNRTGEREAELIRPMPVLQKTMEYLLSLLDQPYDENFLGLYNFLWDRMRAIRMDLRMQHIFNLRAVSMLEQMIRLHIIAMHELCEYTRGEGFSEGFDAHLNIEQMNKASVELFQMYDDHRKRGTNIPTEKEFRGYYALLKLDKHPGYKVEPSELSLDLARMTRETRQTQDVLFARKVARSCRTGNFIAFFRLVRRATYLQSCLMHAHFSKLRTQALASLHCGVQNNQGFPVTHVSKWLGLEKEGVEDLLQHHGFLIKEFEEPYMVKDGPFLNCDKDYLTRCSVLVHLKKSKTILADVLSSHQEVSQPQDTELVKNIEEKPKPLKSPQGVSSHAMEDEEMNKSGMKYQLGHHQLSTNLWKGWDSQRVGANSLENEGLLNSTQPLKDYRHSENFQPVVQVSQPWIFSVPKLIPEPQPLSFDWMTKQTVQVPAVQFSKSTGTSLPQADERTRFKFIPPGIGSEISEETSTASHHAFVASSIQHDMVIDRYRDYECTDVCQIGKNDSGVTNKLDAEVANAKLKLCVRLWRRHSQRKRQMLEQNRLAAYAAMDSLSLGPPLKKSRDKPDAYERFNVHEIMSKRYDEYDHSWSVINVADLVGDQLCEINTNSQCICWKIILYSPTQEEGYCKSLSDQSTLDQWLHSKLMPASAGECNNGLVTSSPGLAIWRKWVLVRPDVRTCCLSVVKDISFLHPENLVGANGILFSISQSVPWEHQKIQLHHLVSLLPSGAATSMLILSDSSKEEFLHQSFFNQLGLDDLDESKIRSFRFVHLHESRSMKQIDGYCSDEQLREGLKWLAAESRPQPALCNVKTRELVLAHLNLSLGYLNEKCFQEIDPNQCISAFNEALDKSTGHIVAAANANPHGWPCPELSLLDHSSEELRAVKLYMPSLGWSSQEKIQQLVYTLGLCKLPSFLDETSFLNQGSCTFHEFAEQRLHLQDCLISYLNQSSKLMSLTLSIKEADAMLKKGARLELRGTLYYLVPNWVLIFRRVFNWKLNRLSGRRWSSAYILEQHHHHFSPRLDVNASMGQPSLDEIVAVSFREGTPSVSISSTYQSQASQNVPPICSNGYCRYSEEVKKNTSSMDGDKENTEFPEPKDSCDASMSSNCSGQNLTFVFSPGADTLSRLLEQCNMLQNKIADKLSVYL